jgi:hypothetical protein
MTSGACRSAFFSAVCIDCGVGADLALVDHRLLVLEQELDRVLDGEDVARDLLVAVVHHRGQRGALAGAGGAHHQQQAALFHDQVAQDHGHAERLQRRDVGGDVADDGGVGAALAHGRKAEVAHALDRLRHVQLAGLFELGDAARRQHFGQQRLGGVRRQQLVVDRHALPVDLDQRRRVRRQVDVRGLLLAHQAQDPLHRAHVLLLLCVAKADCRIRAQQVVQAGLGPRLGVHALDDDGGVQAVPAAVLGQAARDHHRAEGMRPKVVSPVARS